MRLDVTRSIHVIACTKEDRFNDHNYHLNGRWRFFVVVKLCSIKCFRSNNNLVNPNYLMFIDAQIIFIVTY